MSDLGSTTELKNLADVAPLGAYLRSVWDRRRYAIEVPLAEFRVQNLNTALGQLWHLLTPALSMLVYYIVFGVLLKTDRGEPNFVLFLGAGLSSFRYSQLAATKGAAVIPQNLGLIRSIRFPRAILPLSTTFSELLSQGPSLVVLMILAVATGEVPGPRWLALIPITLLQTMFNFGLVAIMARIGEKLRDLTNLLPFFFRLLFYMSGVLYAIERYISDELILKIFTLNPFFSYIEITRWAILGRNIGSLHWIVSIVWAVVLAPVGLLFFRGGEAQYGRP